MTKISCISARNTGCLVAVVVLCSDLIYGASTVYQDTWLAALMALACAVPMGLLYARIAGLFPEQGLFDLTGTLLGPRLGTVITGLFTWYALHVSALALRNFSEFTVDIELQNTPHLVIMAAILSVSACLSVVSFKTMGRWALIILTLVAANLVFTLFITARAMDITNLLPVLQNGLADITWDAASIGAVAFEETVLILIVFGSFAKEENP